MKLNTFSNEKIFLCKSKLLTIIADKNKSIGAMFYGNVCQNSHFTSAYNIIATNFISVSASVCHNCIIV